MVTIRLEPIYFIRDEIRLKLEQAMNREIKGERNMEIAKRLLAEICTWLDDPVVDVKYDPPRTLMIITSTVPEVYTTLVELGVFMSSWQGITGLHPSIIMWYPSSIYSGKLDAVIELDAEVVVEGINKLTANFIARIYDSLRPTFIGTVGLRETHEYSRTQYYENVKNVWTCAPESSYTCLLSGLTGMSDPRMVATGIIGTALGQG